MWFAGLSRTWCRAAFAGFFAVLFLTVPGGVVPVAHAQFSEREQSMGEAAHPRIVAQFGGVYDDAAVGPYVAEITARVAKASDMPDETYRVTVLNSPVVNAFALPGGYVYVTRGLVALANSEAELASVIAHEIGHVTGGHGVSRQNRQIGATLLGAVLGMAVGSDLVNSLFSAGASGYLANYSREQEAEADETGVATLRRAGYDPFAASRMLAALGAQDALHAELAGSRYDANRVDWLSSHPATGQRVRATRVLAAEGGVEPYEKHVGADAHMRAIDGMLYGDDPKEGFVRGRAFYHTELRFAFEVPEGFRMTNTSRAVLATGPEGSTLRFDSAPLGDARSMAGYIRDVWASDVRIAGLRPLNVNGMAAATGTTYVKGNDVRLIAIRPGGSDTVYRFMVSSPPRVTDALDAAVLRMAQSFRKLSLIEANAIKPLKIDIRRVRSGDTVASLARRSAFADEKEKRFRVLNGLSQDEEVERGREVKLVEED